MSELSCLVTITGRDRLAEFITLYQERDVPVNFVALGHGTAVSEMMDVLGLENSTKAICFSIVTDESWKKIKQALETTVYIDVPGTGIAFTVPLSSIGGMRELKYLTAGQDFVKGEESVMKDTENELLLVICNQGYSERVMEAARSAGAGGGTVVHARGTGAQQAEKFLGISLASEKDIIFIVTKSSAKKEMMSAIMRDAGTDTKAGSIVFSLPVTDTAGLKLLQQADESAAK